MLPVKTVLENDVALLRALQPEDEELLRPFSLNEPELWRYSLTPADGLENLRYYIGKAVVARRDEHAFPFLVIDKRTNEVAGSTRFYDFQRYHQSTQLGYTWYGKKFQGTGLNKHCKYLMLSCAFEVLNLERVEFRADANNARSIAAMKRIGCVEEGVLRSNCNSSFGRRDSIVLSILKEEWFAKVRADLKKQLGGKEI